VLICFIGLVPVSCSVRDVRGARHSDVEVEINSLGSAPIWVVDRLNVRITSSGNVNYYGNPIFRLRSRVLEGLSRWGTNKGEIDGMGD
jgi:hypothetical protein